MPSPWSPPSPPPLQHQERNLDKTRKRQAKRTARLNTWQKDLQARADLEEQMVTMVQVQESLVEEATNASHYVQHMEGRLEKQKHKSSTIEAIMVREGGE